MDVKTLSQNDEIATYLVKDTSAAYVNTLRRMIIQKVPTMAIEDITFQENGSALYDEFVAHRLGLVPLTTDQESYELKSKCKCGGNGCAMCELTLTMDKKGPCTVYAEDLKSADPKVKPAYPKMIITKLLQGQNLKFEAKAVLGTGKDHIKFVPGKLFFKGQPEIKIDQSQASSITAEQCPPKILKMDGKNMKVTDANACILCKACEETSPEGAIKIKGSDKNFILTVESWGQLSTRDIMKTAVETLNEDLKELKEAVKSL